MNVGKIKRNLIAVKLLVLARRILNNLRTELWHETSKTEF